MNIQKLISSAVIAAFQTQFQYQPDEKLIQISKTKKEFEGDFTMVVFPFVKELKLSPDDIAQKIGNYLIDNIKEIAKYNVIKGFLNITLSAETKFQFLINYQPIVENENKNKETILVEYASPNTNKPLHLGHIRNILLGYSVAEILKATGKNVKKVQIVNDRGIHICKSMLAWQKLGNGETPESSGLKGDHLVGKYYVAFDKEYKKQIIELKAQGLSEEEAEKKAPILLEAQEMLLKWEAGNEAVVELWKTMNSWVYAGFDKTYKKLEVDFDQYDYESETYITGKQKVEEGLAKGYFYQKPDNSIWIDLKEEGLDEKLLLRNDGTSVYITQDIGTALLRHAQHNMQQMVYVVGNEQDYHFKVLKAILIKMGCDWAHKLYHLSYGMVELPNGKMKSREGTVVDADDLIAGMIEEATNKTMERGRIEEMTTDEIAELNRIIAGAALKYFILKVDPKKKMLFNPEESIDLNGNTGPFVQYTHARIKAILRKNTLAQFDTKIEYDFKKEEVEIIKNLYQFQNVLNEAADSLNPGLLCNYVYDLAKDFNSFYQAVNINKETNENIKQFRLTLSQKTADTIKEVFRILGMHVPETM
jgi:arginyl-tRNA synthetase